MKAINNRKREWRKHTYVVFSHKYHISSVVPSVEISHLIPSDFIISNLNIQLNNYIVINRMMPKQIYIQSKKCIVKKEHMGTMNIL